MIFSRKLPSTGRGAVDYPEKVTSADAPSGSPSEGLASPTDTRGLPPGHHPKWVAHLLRPINRRYGTYRGLIRLWLTEVVLALGQRGPLTRIDMGAVRRVVFVCQGNICRSPFAEFAACRLGMRATSFGLATGGKIPAFPLAVETGRRLGFDLTAHRARDIEDFRFEPGDLVVAMELRHLRRLGSAVKGKPVQMSLLGLWAPHPRPHIQDPHRLHAEYFETCFRVITASVEGLALRLRDAPVWGPTRG